MTEVSISATKDGKRQQRKPELNRLMARSDVALGSTTWVSLEGPAMLSELDMLVKIGREGKRKQEGVRVEVRPGFDSLLLLPLSFSKWLLRFFAKAMSSSTTPTATLDEFKVTSIWLTSISAAADLPNDTKLEVH